MCWIWRGRRVQLENKLEIGLAIHNCVKYSEHPLTPLELEFEDPRNIPSRLLMLMEPAQIGAVQNVARKFQKKGLTK